MAGWYTPESRWITDHHTFHHQQLVRSLYTFLSQYTRSSTISMVCVEIQLFTTSFFNLNPLCACARVIVVLCVLLQCCVCVCVCVCYSSSGKTSTKVSYQRFQRPQIDQTTKKIKKAISTKIRHSEVIVAFSYEDLNALHHLLLAQFLDQQVEEAQTECGCSHLFHIT